MDLVELGLDQGSVGLGWDGLEYRVLTTWLQVDLGIKGCSIKANEIYPKCEQ
jgi:hypothetical protein